MECASYPVVEECLEAQQAGVEVSLQGEEASRNRAFTDGLVCHAIVCVLVWCVCVCVCVCVTDRPPC